MWVFSLFFPTWFKLRILNHVGFSLFFPTWFKLGILNHVSFFLVHSYLVQVQNSEPCGLCPCSFLLGSSSEFWTMWIFSLFFPTWFKLGILNHVGFSLFFPTWFKLRILNHVGFVLVLSYLVQVRNSEPCGFFPCPFLLGSSSEFWTMWVLSLFFPTWFKLRILNHVGCSLFFPTWFKLRILNHVGCSLFFPTWFKLGILNHVGFFLVLSYLVQVKNFEPCGFCPCSFLLGSS